MIFKNNKYGEPKYKVIAEHGPDHAKQYEIGIIFRGKIIASSIESSKKKAEMKTAKLALKYFIN
jgi:ribonuclease-3